MMDDVEMLSAIDLRNWTYTASYQEKCPIKNMSICMASISLQKVTCASRGFMAARACAD